MTGNKMSPTQLTLLTALNMLGSGIIMLPAKLAEVGMISSLSWIFAATGAVAISYVFARCGMLSKRPGLGGIAEYAFGHTGAFMVNCIYGFSLITANIAITYSALGYLLGLVGGGIHTSDNSSIWIWVGTVALLWVATLLNFRGARFTGVISVALIWGVLLPVLVLLLMGGFWFEASTFAVNWNPTGLSAWDATTASIALTFWCFLGLESACANGDAVENPSRNVPRSVLIATVSVAVLYVVTTSLIAGIVPSEQMVGSTAPFGVVFAAMIGEGAGAVVASTLVLAMIGSLVSWQFTLSRVFKTSAEVGDFPAIFARTNAKGVPIVGFIILTSIQSILALLVASPNLLKQFDFLVDFSVITNIIPYVLCMAGSFYLSRKMKLSRGRLIQTDICATYGIAFLFLLFLSMDSLTMKIGAISVFLGWVLYGVRRAQTPDENIPLISTAHADANLKSNE